MPIVLTADLAKIGASGMAKLEGMLWINLVDTHQEPQSGRISSTIAEIQNSIFTIVFTKVLIKMKLLKDHS